MNEEDEAPHSLEEMLDRLAEAGRGGRDVCLSTMVDAVGRKSFAPVLLLAGLIVLSPISGIPGVPTLVALVLTSATAVVVVVGLF